METEVVIAWVESIHKEVTITEACAWLGIARATYYRWKTTWESKHPDPMVEKVVQLCTQHKFRYGYQKITALLRIEGPINHKRIQRIMQYEDLQCRVRIKNEKTQGNQQNLRNIC